MAQTVPVFLCLDFSSNPPGLRCPVFAARHGGRLQKADRIPLALSRFSRRGAVPACENRSAAPNTAPCFIHRMRSLCLPLLRFGCFCRRQRLSSAVPNIPLGTKFPGEPRTRLTARTLPPGNFPVGVRAVRACRPARTDFEMSSFDHKAGGAFILSFFD